MRICLFLLLCLLVLASACKDPSQTCGYCGMSPGEVHAVATELVPGETCPGLAQGNTCVIELTADANGCFELQNCQNWWYHLNQIRAARASRKGNQ